MDQNFHSHKINKGIRDLYYNLIEENFSKVVYSYETQIVEAVDLKKFNNCLRWIQLAGSAITTGGIIGTLINDCIFLTWISAIVSTIVLIITAYFKDNTFANQYKEHKKTADELWELRENYLVLLTKFDSLSDEDIEEQIELLKNRAAQIYKEAPITSEKSYNKAKKKIKEEEVQFFTREEINQILPESLRK